MKSVNKAGDSLDWSKSFMYSIHQTYFLVEKKLEHKLLKIGKLTFSQFLILLPLHCKGEASQTDIAAFLHLTEATVSRHINGLAKAGMLTKKEDSRNRRKHILALTIKGTKEFSNAHKTIELELKSIFEIIPVKNRKIITSAFDKVLDRLVPKNSQKIF